MAGGGGNSSCLSDESGHSADDSRGDDTAERRSLRQQSKERAIEHVLQQGKILKVHWNTFFFQNHFTATTPSSLFYRVLVLPFEPTHAKVLYALLVLSPKCVR
jgi:hypothetical protein